MSATVIGNIVVGKKDVDLTAPSHVAGVHEGNHPGKLAHTEGIRHGEARNVSLPTQSTGIDPKRRMPINPAMPKLTPA